MACATLKRSYDFDPVLSPQHQSLSKRRRCNPMSSSPSHPENVQSPSPFAEVTPKVSYEELTSNVKDEWRRMQRRRKLNTESPMPASSSEVCPQSSYGANMPHLQMPFGSMWGAQPTHNTWSSPSSSPQRDGSLSPPRRDQPTFTLKQVVLLCERLWKEREEKLKEEYDKVLNDRLAEQYDAFLKFTQDQIMRRYQESSCSYGTGLICIDRRSEKESLSSNTRAMICVINSS